jgi:hypothetical protein
LAPEHIRKHEKAGLILGILSLEDKEQEKTELENSYKDVDWNFSINFLMALGDLASSPLIISLADSFIHKEK